MNRMASAIVCLVLWTGSAIAEPLLDENTLMAIRAEFAAAIKNADPSPFEKYLYSGSKIIIDLDPSPSAGEMQVSYEQYMKMLEMALALMKDADIHEEIISISIDVESNEGTIKEKTTAMMDVMGMKIRDVSVSETTYGIIDGTIKVLVAREQLISSGPIE